MGKGKYATDEDKRSFVTFIQDRKEMILSGKKSLDYVIERIRDLGITCTNFSSYEIQPILNFNGNLSTSNCVLLYDECLRKHNSLKKIYQRVKNLDDESLKSEFEIYRKELLRRKEQN